MIILANALMENRNGLVIGADVRHAIGTMDADKGYDVCEFVEQRGIRPHVACSTKGRRSAIDARERLHDAPARDHCCRNWRHWQAYTPSRLAQWRWMRHAYQNPTRVPDSA